MSLSRTKSRRRGASGGWIKRLLPRTLFGRSILILITPLILVQAVAAWVFYDRLWDTVMHRLSAGVVGEIALVIQSRNLIPKDEDWEEFYATASQTTELGFRHLPGAHLADTSPRASGTLIERQLVTALNERVHLPYQIDEKSDIHNVLISIQLPDAVLRVAVPRSRLFTSNTYIVLMWMVGTALITFAVATQFLRNQVRSLRRLAIAAEAFGKGRDMPNFKPEGAAEVRQAAAAFLVMRERIQRQISQRTEMLAGVSHDLRTPLTRMKLELELLGDDEDIQALKSDVDEMQQMLEGYLSFARGEGNEAPQVTDLIELLSDAVANGRRGGSTIELATPKELHVPMRRDAFRRCVMNLIGNATRYGGKVWVSVATDRSSVDVLVDDDGPGIPEAEREEVFRPFYRLESSRNRSTGGVGLGLTIARDIMRSHGGDLTLETAPQGGLRARMHLPR